MGVLGLLMAAVCQLSRLGLLCSWPSLGLAVQGFARLEGPRPPWKGDQYPAAEQVAAGIVGDLPKRFAQLVWWVGDIGRSAGPSWSCNGIVSQVCCKLCMTAAVILVVLAPR